MSYNWLLRRWTRWRSLRIRDAGDSLENMEPFTLTSLRNVHMSNLTDRLQGKNTETTWNMRFNVKEELKIYSESRWWQVNKP